MLNELFGAKAKYFCMLLLTTMEARRYRKIMEQSV